MIGIDPFTALVLLYISMNVVSAVVFTLDKRRARRNTWRTSENTLLGLAFLGPFGAFIAMQIFRHKTRKIRFWLVPLFMVIHLAVIACLALAFLQ